MNIKKVAVIIGGAAVISGTLFTQAYSADKSGGVYPNDFGTTSIDVSHYPPKMKMYYHLFLNKCSACHTIARPINSQFLQLTADEQAADKKTNPEMFKNPLVWQIGPKIWSQYVHRMMSKPGANIRPAEGKKIFEFLVYDSKVRKTGANAEAWEANREKLLKSFKQNYPKDYARIFGASSSSKKTASGASSAPASSPAQHS